MILCKECGVELDDQMQICPLCGSFVLNDGPTDPILKKDNESNIPDVRKKHLLSKVLLQIASILLLSGIASTLIINFAIEGKITWCVYPMTVCLIILSYVALISFWRTRIIYQVLGGWILAATVLVIINVLNSEQWPLMLALPILCAANVIAFLLAFVLSAFKTKGLNIFAIFVSAIAVLCLVIEGIISFYSDNTIKLQWSAIVAACLFPVTAAVLFMYFRTRNNNDFKKIFHT